MCVCVCVHVQQADRANHVPMSADCVRARDSPSACVG